MRALVIAALIGCGSKAPKPVPEPPVVPQPTRQDFAVGDDPMNLVVIGSTLVWTDATGAVFTMPTTGGTPTQLSNQKLAFAFSLVAVGNTAFAATKKDLLRISLPSGPVALAGIKGLPENPESVVADDDAIYCTIFRHDAVMRIPAAGGAAQKLFDIRRGVPAVHAGKLYVVSYSTGTLVTIPTTGGKPRTIATGLVRITSIAADDQFVFAYSEREKAIRKIEIATGASTTLASGLENSDELVSDGPWLYTYSWDRGGRVLRIAKAGGEPETLGEDLKSPYAIAFDAQAVYVTVRDQDKIVRFAKR